MLRHALKLVWNRRRSNGLVVVEVAAAFVVTFVLLAACADLWSNYRRPLGFEYERVWGIALRGERLDMREVSVARTIEDLLAALRALPRVEAAHRIALAPFTYFNFRSVYRTDNGSVVPSQRNVASAEALRALGVRLVEGRWFNLEDEAGPYDAALVNRVFVDRLLGPGSDPLVAGVTAGGDPPGQLRIVGVIEDFRQDGEFAEAAPYVITPDDVNEANVGELFVKVAPGTEAAFEERILATIAAIAPEWTATITPWERRRAAMHARTLLPVKAGATLAGFMLGMVVLGLVGVLWQDVVRRTQEIGLRRAVGASAAGVRRQIAIEMLVVGAFGVVLGTAVAVQFPLLKLVEQIDWAAAVPGLVLAMAVVLLLTALAALYPSWLASRREPADALRYE